jgi:hypothetical protein
MSYSPYAPSIPGTLIPIEEIEAAKVRRDANRREKRYTIYAAAVETVLACHDGVWPAEKPAPWPPPRAATLVAA